MSSSKRRLSSSRVEAFLDGLSGLASSLPTRQEKDEIEHDLGVVISFLMDFKDRIGSLPTEEDVSGVITAVERLRHYIHISESNDAIANALGIEKPRTRSRSKRGALVSFNLSEEVSIIKRLESAEVLNRFQDEKKFTMANLRLIGEKLGVRTTTNASRPEVVEQIVVHLRNEAGYALLRNRS